MANGAARMARNKLFIHRIHWTCSERKPNLVECIKHQCMFNPADVLKRYFEEFGPVSHAAIAYVRPCTYTDIAIIIGTGTSGECISKSHVLLGTF